MLLNESFGTILQYYCKIFFGKSYAFYYIKNSRINEAYKIQHLKKISRFYEAC